MLGPVTGQQFQALTARHPLAVGALEARAVEVGRVARGAHETGVSLTELGQELVEALVVVQTAADLVDGVGAGR